MNFGGGSSFRGGPQEEGAARSKGFDIQLMGRLLAYLRPYWGWVILTFGAVLSASLLRQLGPYITKIAVDDYIIPGDRSGFGWLIFLYVGTLVLQFFIGYGQTWVTNMVGQWTMSDVRMAIFSHLQRLPLRFFDRTPVGTLMARNTNDVDALNEMFTNGAVELVSNVFTVATIMGFIFLLDVELGLITCAALPVTFLVTLWLQGLTFRAFRDARTHFGEFAGSLQETISGMEIVQMFNCEDRSIDRFGEGNDRYNASRLQSTWYHSAYFPFMELCGALMMALVLWYGGHRVLEGRVEWGVLVAMLQYVPRFFMPMRDIAERYASLQSAMASSERVFELLDAEPESPGGTFEPEQVRGEIEFKDVWFSYTPFGDADRNVLGTAPQGRAAAGNQDEDSGQNPEWVLRGVSFKVEPGQSMAIVGATGAGKSTIINLVCRFYPIQEGRILVDGVDIRDWDVEALRRCVGVVQQDVFLFAGNIEENISLGAPEVTHDRVIRAARDVNADRFIDKLLDGYDQHVQERGASLSVGQRQLLSFARALAADPDILVLDEATSNVDTETEMWIQEAVEKLMNVRTSIVIAHRLSTIRNADKILVLHHGKVSEEGNHQELLDEGGIYSRLHELQYNIPV
ncbi:MAG TPA: antibiotic ABC transporter ATP-binding protein [Candidatus Latescibacteria bacterium]|nr:antibiotic ABC transporter ATP-binding protein [Candidatus Latescibacterota bacterium]